MDVNKPKPCECERYSFPHRFQEQCRDFRDPEPEYSLADDLREEDYRDRVRDLRADIAANTSWRE